MADNQAHTTRLLYLHVIVSGMIEDVGIGRTPDEARAALAALLPPDEADATIATFGVPMAVELPADALRRTLNALGFAGPAWVDGPSDGLADPEAQAVYMRRLALARGMPPAAVEEGVRFARTRSPSRRCGWLLDAGVNERRTTVWLPIDTEDRIEALRLAWPAG